MNSFNFSSDCQLEEVLCRKDLLRENNNLFHHKKKAQSLVTTVALHYSSDVTSNPKLPALIFKIQFRYSNNAMGSFGTYLTALTTMFCCCYFIIAFLYDCKLVSIWSIMS